MKKSHSVPRNLSARYRAVYDVRVGNEPGFLQGLARRLIVDAAPRRGDAAQLVGQALHLLHQIGAEAAPAEWFGDLHVQVAVGRVVVEEDAAFAGGLAPDLQLPLRAPLAFLDRSA